jgi:uncharacterized beta-barrel protein YwiB (DUF1934 family)
VFVLVDIEVTTLERDCAVIAIVDIASGVWRVEVATFNSHIIVPNEDGVVRIALV